MTTFAPHRANGFPSPAPGSEIHGEIIAWDTEGVTVTFAHLLEALDDSGLDRSVARRMLPRNAFARACRRLSENRIIRKVDEDEAVIRFQFTAEAKDGPRFRYDLETILSLHKESGDIECSIPGLADRARAAVDEAMGTRNGGDVTRVIQKLFDDKTKADLDLVPIRPQGGAYFVRKERLDFVDHVEAFVIRLNARLVRLPIAAGSDHGDRCVRDAVAARMTALIGEFESAVESFGTDTRERTLTAAAERVRLLRHKVDSYATYLDTEKGRLGEALARAAARLRAKVADIARECGTL